MVTKSTTQLLQIRFEEFVLNILRQVFHAFSHFTYSRLPGHR